MFRVSVTKVESFARWRRDTEEMCSEQDVIDSIMGKVRPNDFMTIGGAVADALEKPERLIHVPGEKQFPYVIHDAEKKPRVHLCDTTAEAIMAEAARPMEREVPGTMTYLVGGVAIEVSSRADGLFGVEGEEYKCKFSPFDIEVYEPSCQWRFYCDIFGLRSVQYTVFGLKNHGACHVEYSYLEKVKFYPSVENRNEVENLLAEFWDYVAFRKLEDYIRPRR